MWRVKMVSKSKNYFSPMLICWNDIKIHLGFEDSYFVPPPTFRRKVLFFFRISCFFFLSPSSLAPSSLILFVFVLLFWSNLFLSFCLGQLFFLGLGLIMVLVNLFLAFCLCPHVSVAMTNIDK